MWGLDQEQLQIPSTDPSTLLWILTSTYFWLQLLPGGTTTGSLEKLKVFYLLLQNTQWYSQGQNLVSNLNFYAIYIIHRLKVQV